MTQEVHAHKLLNTLRETPMSRDELKAFALETFGTDTSFCTCKLKGFDVDGILNFFVEQEKVIEKEGVWMLNESEICSH